MKGETLLIGYLMVSAMLVGAAVTFIILTILGHIHYV